MPCSPATLLFTRVCGESVMEQHANHLTILQLIQHYSIPCSKQITLVTSQSNTVAIFSITTILMVYTHRLAFTCTHLQSTHICTHIQLLLAYLFVSSFSNFFRSSKLLFCLCNILYRRVSQVGLCIRGAGLEQQSVPVIELIQKVHDIQLLNTCPSDRKGPANVPRDFSATPTSFRRGAALCS